MAAKAPRHVQVMRVLRNRIVHGVYEGKLPGERQLAAELGTNPKTIQLALVQLEAIGMVRRVQREGTFAVPLSGPRGAASLVYARLALEPPLSASGEADFWASVIIHAFQRAAHDHNLSMALEYSSDVDAVMEETLAEVRSPGCMGTCILGMPLETRHVLQLADVGGPVVLADWDLEEPLIPCIVFDNLGAGRLAAEHLVKLGHRHIALVDSPETSPSLRERCQGVVGLLTDAGLGVARNVTYAPGRPEDLLALLNGPTRPTAVISTSRTVAEIFIELAAAAGRRIPDDLSLVTFGGGRVQRRHPVTMIAMDHEALGERALEMLLDEELLANPRRVLLPVKLSEAGTTAPAPGN